MLEPAMPLPSAKPVLRTVGQRCLFVLALLPALPAAALDIPTTPLKATQSVYPNILFLLDDSGSMQWEIMPEDYLYSYHLFPPPVAQLYGGTGYGEGSGSALYRLPSFREDNIYNVFLRSSGNNTVYYDPSITYLPWKDANGDYYASGGKAYADPTAAYWNPGLTSKGSIDLTAQQTSKQYWFQGTGSFPATMRYCSNTSCSTDVSQSGTTQSHSYWPMTWHVYKGSGSKLVVGSYYRYQIRTVSSQLVGYRKDLSSGSETEITTFPSGRTVQEEARNFATWFQYYRSRLLAAKASTSLAFSDLGTSYRVGFATINGRGSDSSYISVPSSGDFSSTARSNFFDALLQLQIDNSGTPLRTALAWAGSNYKSNYWKDTISCRRAFTILTTDGYWNDSYSGVGNADSDQGLPYKDSYSNTLADVAMYYWKTDLSTLGNTVFATSKDAATWQHMSTFGLSLGTKGSLDPASDLPGLEAGTTSWPNPTASNAAKIDDLWHAAVNGHGSFVAAANPEEFREGLASALSQISQQAGSQSAGEGSTEVYADDSLYFQASFDSANWTGELTAYPLTLSSGSVVPSSTASWAAAALLTSDSNRKILFGDGTVGNAGYRFVWGGSGQSTLSSAGLSEALVNYVRGSGSNEGTTSTKYRIRTTRLGDIIGSSPLYVGAPSSTLSSASSRSAMVYVGANDGMLHAFYASSGKEAFAYIPSLLLSKLSSLSAQDYKENHQYYVDGLLSAAEAEDQAGSGWGTYLAGSLGRGGEGLFLLNVTQPDSVADSDTSARSLVAWEFTKKHDSNMGILHQSAPAVVRLNDGKDYVLAPNGYNSSTGSASLFILPVRRGLSSWSGNYYRLQAQAGPDNGLSAITPYDMDGNGTIDLVYAGDLKGQVWKFDLSGSTPSSWKVGIGGVPLFQAYGPNGKPQPVISAPVVATHPSNGATSPSADKTGLMVYVGTGRYLASCDKAGGSCSGEDTTDSIYGLWDYGGQICSRLELLNQTLSTLTLDGTTYRTITNHTLVYPPSGIAATACSSNNTARSEMYTLKADGISIDTRYAFPALTLSDSERAAQSSYWLGWRIDLPVADERVVSYLDYYKKRLEVQTFIPASVSSDPCVTGDDVSYILRLNYQNGGTFSKPRFVDDTITSAISSGNSSASSIVGKQVSGSLGRTKVKNGARYSTLLSLTGGGTGGALDEAIARTITRVSWREVISE